MELNEPTSSLPFSSDSATEQGRIPILMILITQQFVTRSAPCAFLQSSSLHVLRPVPSSTAVRYTFCALCLPPEQFVTRSAPCAFFQSRPLFTPYSSYCTTSVSLPLHSLCSPLFRLSMKPYLLSQFSKFPCTKSDPDFPFSTATPNHSSFCVFNICANNHNPRLV